MLRRTGLTGPRSSTKPWELRIRWCC